jgi:hypothetical protein
MVVFGEPDQGDVYLFLMCSMYGKSFGNILFVETLRSGFLPA